MSAEKPISIVTMTTLFPNAAKPSHGIFVETRLRKLLATGMVDAHVIAPVPWLPPMMVHESLGALGIVPRAVTRDNLTIEHPRFVVIPKVGMSVAPYLLFRAFERSIARLLAKGRRIDLIDAHYFYPDGVAAVWVARRFNIPVVVTARGTDLNLIPQYPGPRQLIQRAANNADGIITVCEALRECFVELGISADDVTVLRNGVDLDRFQPTDRSAARARLDLKRTTLASVGHLVERKGHHHVIAALPALPDTDLLIAGDGPERAALRALAERLGVAERVRFLGTLDQPQLRGVYVAVDALVLASSREGWANVLLESMACGTPVVASAVWGTPEVVADHAAGVLMPSLDAAGVVAGVKELLANPPVREATRKYATGFDWAPTTEGQLRLFEAILKRRADRLTRTAA